MTLVRKGAATVSEHLDKGNLYDRLNQAIQQTRELVVSMEGLQEDDDARYKKKTPPCQLKMTT